MAGAFDGFANIKNNKKNLVSFSKKLIDQYKKKIQKKKFF